MDRGDLRVFVGYTEVAGFYSSMTNELREAGCTVKHLGGNNHNFSYSLEEVSLLDRLFYVSLRKSSVIMKPVLLLLRELLSIFYGVCIAAKYDVFLVGYNRPCSIFGIDMLIARLGGVLVLTFGHHGSESRPPVLSAAYANSSDLYIALMTIKTFYFCRLTALLSHFNVTNPLYDHFFKEGKRNIFYLAFGTPANTVVGRKVNEALTSDFSILHIPSSKDLKGTVELQKIFKGRLTISEGLSHSEAIETFLNSSVVIDQLYSDNPYPATTRENLILDNNVVIAGYDLDKLAPLASGLGYSMPHVCKPEELPRKVEALLRKEEKVLEPTIKKKRVFNALKQLRNGVAEENLFYEVGRHRSYAGVGFSSEKLEEKLRVSRISRSFLKIFTG